jgi:hypothetical protein
MSYSTTPVIKLHDRTAQRGEAIENSVQLFGRERIGEGLRPLPVVDTQKGVVGKGEADAGGGKLPRQPNVPDSDRSDPAPSPTPPLTRPSEVCSVLFGSDAVQSALFEVEQHRPPRK